LFGEDDVKHKSLVWDEDKKSPKGCKSPTSSWRPPLLKTLSAPSLSPPRSLFLLFANSSDGYSFKL